MRYFSWILFCLCESGQVYAQNPDAFNPYLKNNNQVLIVQAPSYTSIEATMKLYERKNNRKTWRLIYSFPVTVGRTGLAKDGKTKLSFANSVPVKHEGDGKSPAGIFSLGRVFSYHDLKNLHMPFVKVDTNFLCVDDMNSAYYNRLIVADTAHPDYNSFEYMKRRDSLYEFGVWVLYNSDPVMPGNGSCIFIHVWRNENSPTSGCTAMSRENILKLIYRLDKKKNPVLVQTVE